MQTLLSPAFCCGGVSFWALLRQQHFFAALVGGILELRPPLTQFHWHLAALATQQHKVIGRTEARQGQQTQRALARALLQARLQQPDFFHDRIVAVRNGQLRTLFFQHFIHRIVQRGYGGLARFQFFIPRTQHFMPQQCGKQEGR